MSNSQPSKIISFFENARSVIVCAAFFCAFFATRHAANILLIGYVIPMTGLLAIEGSFFRAASAAYKGRETSIYQLQSAYFNLAIFLVSCYLMLFHGVMESKVIIIALLTIFFLLSSCTHLSEYLNGAPKVNLWRFVGSIMLVAMITLVLCMQYYQL